MTWTPTTIEEAKAIVREQLAACDDEQRLAYSTYAVEPFLARIERFGGLEEVVVVAKKGNEAMYWEDVEEGFNIAPIDENGLLLARWCNQDDLMHALNYWIAGRRSSKD